MRRLALLSGLLSTSALVGVSLLAPAAVAQNLPTGGRVVSGTATIGETGNRMVIQQGSDRAIVNWQGFSVGQNARVDIYQPSSSSAILNRVTGDTPSTIAGQINANGQFFLINPNGIAITRTGSVNAGAFAASTLGISDDDFKAGRLNFRGSGASAAVSNAGAVTVGPGGYAALLGGHVSNSGTITAPAGRVSLGSGEAVTLDLSGDGFLQVAVPTASGGRGALVRNSGTIRADGGSVQLSAATAREVARHAVNMSGVIEARGVSGRSGAIELSGGDGGAVKVSGRMDASSSAGTGGGVTVTGRKIALRGASVDASGATGGGKVRIGGDRQGQGTLQHAERVSVDSATSIRADATGQGHGGDVVVWSDQATNFAGRITALGGATGGDGGQAEVSSKGLLSYTGWTDLRAAHGAMGTLLLDPHNVIISNDADSGHDSGYVATADDSVINAGRLATALVGANVRISTGTTGSQAGDITVTVPIAWATGGTLILQAAGAITIGAPITTRTGGLTINAGTNATATADISVGRFELTSGAWVQNMANLPGFTATNFVITGGSFLRAAGGGGTASNPYRLTDVYGLQGIGSSASLLTASYQLANDIDASGTAGWDGGQGFKPIGDGSSSANYFTGRLDGAGHIISGLTINRKTWDRIGLIGALGNGTITKLGMVDVSITGHNYVGGLAGYSIGTVSDAYVTGTITGNLTLGGIVGLNDGTVVDVYATSAVNGLNGVGGIVGDNTGSITNAWASGLLTGGPTVGGVVGDNRGTLGNLYWDIDTTRQSAGTGNNKSTGTTGLTTAQARNAGSYVGLDFTTIWYQTADLRPILRSEAAQAGPDGVITVSNLHQLQLMAANLAGNYRLSADIDARATAGTDASGIFGAGGFVPIGNDSDVPFTGRLDGAGHTISGLTIYRPDNTSNFVGLIGYMAGGSITNLGIVGGSITGDNAGGLVGINDSGTVDNVFSSATVSGAWAGGLIYANTGLVSNAYATGAVTGSFVVGGLIGLNTGGTVSNSYATGAVRGSGLVGGLIGGTLTAQFSSVTNSYWNVDTTGQTMASGDGHTSGAVGLTTAQMSNPFTFIDAGWDFSSVWATSKAGGAPVLRSLTTDPVYNYYVRLVGDSTTTYGTQASTAGVTVTGIGAGNVTLGWGSAVRNAGTYNYSDANVIALNVSAGTASDYYVDHGAGKLTVNKASLTVTANDASKTYDGKAWSGGDGVTYTGLVNGDGASALGGSLSWAGTSQGAINAGNYTLTTSGLTSGNYDIAYVAGKLTVDKASLTVKANDASKTYDGKAWSGNNGVTYTGFVNGENASVLDGSLSYGGTSQGAINAGNYTLTASGLTSGNYDISYAAGALRVDKAALTVKANDASKTYDGTAWSGGNGVTYAGFVNGETESVLGGNLGYGGGAQGAVNAGSYALTASGLTSGNYDITYVGGNLTVGQRAISIAADAQTRIYGDANPNLTYRITGGNLVNNDTLSLTTLADQGSGVGTYAITLAANPNYAVSYTGADLTITPRAITVTADAKSRAYGDANPNFTYQVGGGGLVNGDTLSGDLAAVGATAGVGTYDITLGTLRGSGNYAITYQGADLTITPRAITVAADAKSRAYGDANPNLTYRVTGGNLVNNDSLSLTTLANQASGVGSYGITLVGDPNYAVSYTGAALTVTPRAITVAADAQSRIYGDANPALTYRITGGNLVNNDTLSGDLATAADARSNVGAYGITQGSLTAGGNYAITYQGADLTVGQRAITVTANAQSRDYGDTNRNFTYQVGGLGLVNGDTLSGDLATVANARSNVGIYGITQGSLSAGGNYAITYTGANLTITPRAITVTADAKNRVYGDANPDLTYRLVSGNLVNGDTLTLETSADQRSGVGTYGITLAADPNYAVSYAGADLTITPRAITVTADAQRRMYHDANPNLTYQIGGRGLVNGDQLTGALETTADRNSAPGVYAITQGSLSADGNYVLTYVGANLTVSPTGGDTTALASTVDRDRVQRGLLPRGETHDLVLADGALAGTDTDTRMLLVDPSLLRPVVCFLSQRNCVTAPSNHR